MADATTTATTTTTVTTEPVVDWKLDLNDAADSPFTLVCKNLAKLGSLSVHHFLNAPDYHALFDLSDDILQILPRCLSTTPPPELPPLPDPPPTDPNARDAPLASRMHNVARLHQTCQRVFGNPDAIKFEFLEDDGPKSKQCILTITRPNGPSRSYTTQPIFSRKNDAKAEAAKIAIDMGAIDFIVSGDTPDSSKGKKSLVLAPLDAPSRSKSSGSEAASATPPEDQLVAVKEIADCCAEWRAGLTKPEWFNFVDTKFGTKHGCALRISLSPHSLRVYSVETLFDTPTKAKQECAEQAIAQGVIDYIKHGNGQTHPTVPLPSNTTILEPDLRGYSQPSLTPLTLQGFYDSLPQPFAESFGDKSVMEINAPGWLNTIIQSARGGQLSISFTWITNNSLGLHGCLLRLDRPSETKSYLVDPRFSKRADAKAAACLQAMSQGVGSYIRAIGEEIENRVKPDMRKWANEQIFPVLGSEYSKVRPGCHPFYEFQKEKDAYGCTMKLELSEFPTPDEIKSFIVPIEYRTKVDAKIAVACLAAQEGVIEFVRFRGEPPPAGYIPFVAMRDNQDFQRGGKRKDHPDRGDEVADTRMRKKVKVEDQASASSPSTSSNQRQSKPGATTATTVKRDSNNNKVSGKKPHAPGSSGLVPLSRPAVAAQAGRSIGQNRARSNRYGGGHSTSATMMTMPMPTTTSAVVTMTPYAGMNVHHHNHHPHQQHAQAPQYVIPSAPSFSGTHMAAAMGPHHPLPHPPHPYYPGNAGSHVVPYAFVTPTAPPPHSHPVPAPPPPPPPPPLPPPLSFQPSPPGYPHVTYYGMHPPHQAPIYSTPPPAPTYTGPHQSSYPNPYPPPQHHPSIQYLPPQHPPQHQQQFVPPQPPPPPQQPQQHQQPVTQQQPVIPPNFQTHHHSQHVQPPAFSSVPPNHLPHQSQDHFTTPGMSKASHAKHGKRHDQKTNRNPKMPPKSSAEGSSDHRSQGSKTSREPDSRSKEGQSPESHVTALLDYCNTAKLSNPVFHHETVMDERGARGGGVGKKRYKVWVVSGAERLELPVTFSSVNEGRERVAKQVLGRLRRKGSAAA